MSVSFIKWLQSELEERDWSIRELARRSGLSHSGLSFVLNEEREPGIDVCQGIARAFKIPQVVVFAKAGLITDLDADLSGPELWQLLKRLTPAERRIVLAVAQGKINIDDI